MSLIHDALKKAKEREHKELGSGIASMEEATKVVGERRMPSRKVVLAVGVAVALAVLMYSWFTSGPQKGHIGKSTSTTQGEPSQGAGGIGDAAFFKKKALDAYKLGKYDQSFSDLSQASQLAGADAEIWNNLGVVAKKRGDLNAARRYYGRALELKSDYPEVLNNLAIIEMKEDNDGKAIKLLEKALSIDPAYPEANFQLAVLYEAMGEKVKAVDHYKRFLQVGGDFPSSVVDAVRDHVMEIE